MTEEHKVELAYVERSDGLGLEGAMINPSGVIRKPVVVLWFHGNTSRFYDLPYIQIGRELAKLGYSFLTCNTHGHDILAPIWGAEGEMSPGGALMERFSEVPLDLDPWISYALSRGYSGVILAGHSFGAAKVAYYQAHAQDPRVVGVVLASPDVKWQAEPERVELAEKMVAEGQGDELMPQVEGNPPWYRMSARTLFDRARVAQHVFQSDAGEPHIAHVASPLLAFYGTEEAWCGGPEELRAVKEAATSAPKVDTHLLEGADHVYWGNAPDAARLIAGWADGLIESTHASEKSIASAGYAA
jgi:dienelactone hydrolase